MAQEETRAATRGRYRQRRPEETLLYQVVGRHLKAVDAPVPERESVRVRAPPEQDAWLDSRGGCDQEAGDGAGIRFVPDAG